MHHESCHSLQCILPPHMGDAIKTRGNAKQKKMVETLSREADKARATRHAKAPARRPKIATASTEIPEPDRKVYDAKKKATLPGTLVRKENDEASEDQTVNEAFDGAGDVFKLYSEIYHRDSLDDRGLTLKSSVHVRRNFNNAYWDGEQMAYGDGDGVIFTPLTASLSVIGHELSHGVVQFSGGLTYQDQSGALNESFADVFGVLTEQYKKRQIASEASWLIGEEILGPDIQGDALRSMKAPGMAYDDTLLGKDPQPYHMDFYLNTSSDNGGVHINSGIPNHAFYLLAQYLGGFAWETAGVIWYKTMQRINNPLATFAEWADLTVEIARAEYGIGSFEAQLTRRAWRLVGLAV